MMEGIAEVSPRLKARMAGVFQLLEAITAAFGQVIVLVLLVIPKAAYHPRSAQAAPRLLN